MAKRSAVDVVALLALLLVGLIFLSGLTLSGGYRIYSGLISVTWAVLLAAAVGRWRAGRGGIWRLALVSPLCFFAPILPLALLSRRLRTSLSRDLIAAWGAVAALARALIPSSFPLGAPTGPRLILAVVVSAGIYVAVALGMVMLLVAATAGGSEKDRAVTGSEELWLFLIIPGAAAAIALTYLIVCWVAARHHARADGQSAIG